MKIEINNGRTLEIREDIDAVNSLVFETYDSEGYFEDATYIFEGDLVMLLNYYRNCKSGLEDSDYIRPEVS